MYYGADYYPEHWTPDRLATDAKLMQEAGINVVRMGEFAWAMIEPQADDYQFEWLDEAINVLAAHGIKTILGTPTATPPKWLMDLIGGGYQVNRNGRTRGFGSRRHACANHPGIQWHTRRIAAIMTQHFAHNENVVAWQIDNEFGCHDTVRCYCSHCRQAFAVWLQNRYHTLDELNRAWGTVFWSQIYTDWQQIVLPTLTVCDDADLNHGFSPGLLLDYCRFSSDSWVDFQNMQLLEIRNFDTLHRPITHNFMGHFSDYNAYDMARPLDFVSWDNYPGLQNGTSEGAGTSGVDEVKKFRAVGMAHDLMRGLKNQNFWVMEQQSGPCGWSTMGRTPAPGQLRLWAWQAAAHGADSIIYFRWRAATFGAEQYWYGILDHDGIPRRRYREVAQTGAELAHAALEGAKVCSKVALIKSYENLWSHQFQPHSKAFDYSRLLLEYYSAITSLHVGCDAPSLDDTDLSAYAAVFAPALNMVTEGRQEKLADYVKNGGTLVITYRSGTRTDENQMRADTLPGAFREMAGVTVEEFDAMGEATLKIKSNTKALAIGRAECSIFADMLMPEGAKPLISYSEGWRQEYAAVTVNEFGAGKVYYIGCGLAPQTLSKLVGFILSKVASPNITGGSDDIEAILREKDGNHSLVLLNHGDKAGCATIHRSMTDILTGEKFEGDVQMPPYGVRVMV